jgi:hypothetical protein
VQRDLHEPRLISRRGASFLMLGARLVLGALGALLAQGRVRAVVHRGEHSCVQDSSSSTTGVSCEGSPT